MLNFDWEHCEIKIIVTIKNIAEKHKPKVYFGLNLRYLFHGIFMWNDFKEFTQTKASKILNNDLIEVFYSNSDLNYHTTI